tara:strand:+ start:107 stop:655 length:549 start_codon:yes stop_codon:yes gene_type:complete
MPCTKCEEGNYKWGETGECKYDTLDACEKANHKYSKMKPTPLGKKSYEEYAKELKEFNLSSQRIELGVSDDLESSVKELKGTIKTLKKETKEMLSFLKELRNTNKSLSKSWSNLDGTLTKAKAQEKYSATQIKKLQKAAKELGISYFDIPAVKKWGDLDLKPLEQASEEAKATLKIINKIGI